MAVANTSHSPAELARLLKGARTLWFIGIGGIHMSALAELSRQRGYRVAGSDTAENENTVRLSRAGIRVHPSHEAPQVIGADAVIFTLAIDEKNPEYLTAQALGIPLISRADYLGYLMAEHRCRIAVAGTHGKSTVTTMLGELLARAGRAPNILCGAAMRYFESPYFMGGDNSFVVEACEYGESFLSLSPTLAVVLNAELDHVDCYPDVAAVRRAMAAFAKKSARALLPLGDTALQAELTDYKGECFTFGERGADFAALDIKDSPKGVSLTLAERGVPLGRITMSQSGYHTAQNATAAFGAARLSGMEAEELLTFLPLFQGVHRRMEYRGLFCGAPVFDDYAHHPTEIACSIAAAREKVGGGRLFVLFQSHTYSRTRAFLSEIAAALCGADRVLVTEIYAARETDPLGVGGALLAREVGAKALFVPNVKAAANALAAELRPSDLLIVMGAGDVDRIFLEFSKKHFTL